MAWTIHFPARREETSADGLGGLFNSILVYDKDGNEVTAGLWKFPKLLLTDPVPEDLSDLFSHFEGIHVPGGISRIQFRDFTEVDHLTYGYAPIPEPGSPRPRRRRSRRYGPSPPPEPLPAQKLYHVDISAENILFLQSLRQGSVNLIVPPAADAALRDAASCDGLCGRHP